MTMWNKYFDDLDTIKKQVSRHWKSSFKEKSNKYDSNGDSRSGSSNDESSDDKKKHKNKKNQYALSLNDVEQDRRNQYGVIIYGHCNKP